METIDDLKVELDKVLSQVDFDEFDKFCRETVGVGYEEFESMALYGMSVEELEEVKKEVNNG